MVRVGLYHPVQHGNCFHVTALGRYLKSLIYAGLQAGRPEVTPDHAYDNWNDRRYKDSVEPLPWRILPEEQYAYSSSRSTTVR